MAGIIDAGKTLARQTLGNIVHWAMEGSTQNGSKKTDPVITKYTLDELRRACFYSRYDIMFTDCPLGFPYIKGDTTLKQLLGYTASNVFPTGTQWEVEDSEDLTTWLTDWLKISRWQLIAESLITESALMGYSALRSVYHEGLGRFLLEVKSKEELEIVSEDGIPHEIKAIGLTWKIQKEGKAFWRKERFSKTEYTSWADIEVGFTYNNKPPVFDEAKAIVEANVYGEIPITIIPHYYDANTIGEAMIGKEQFELYKSLVHLRNKLHYANLMHMKPIPVLKNCSAETRINLAPNAVIRLNSGDAQNPADLTLLEWGGIPDSVQAEIYDDIRGLWRSAGFRPPAKDEQDTTGNASSGTALRLRDADDEETFKTLRDNGYSQVTEHFAKVLRMAKNSGFVQGMPTVPEAVQVSVNYPSFFPPTEEEKAVKIANIKGADLPTDVQAKLIGEVFGFDEFQIEELKAHYQQRQGDFNQAINQSIGGNDATPTNG